MRTKRRANRKEPVVISSPDASIQTTPPLKPSTEKEPEVQSAAVVQSEEQVSMAMETAKALEKEATPKEATTKEAVEKKKKKKRVVEERKKDDQGAEKSAKKRKENPDQREAGSSKKAKHSTPEKKKKFSEKEKGKAVSTCKDSVPD